MQRERHTHCILYGVASEEEIRFLFVDEHRAVLRHTLGADDELLQSYGIFSAKSILRFENLSYSFFQEIFSAWL